MQEISLGSYGGLESNHDVTSSMSFITPIEVVTADIAKKLTDCIVVLPGDGVTIMEWKVFYLWRTKGLEWMN